MTIRAVCYPRVSSPTQRERDSIATQLRELPAIAERHGWTLARPVDHYIDDGRSAKAGKLEKRTGLRRLLADAAAGEFDVVIMAAVDRLTRSERWAERGMIIGALQDAGVRVCSSDTGELLDLDTDEGDLIMSLKSYVAAAENRRKSKAIKGGKLTSAIRGGKPTGPDPYGLRYDKASNTWSIDPVRAPIVVEIFERVGRGESTIAIAADLQLRDVPCNGKRWTKALVRYLVHSTHPIGEYVAHRRTRTVVKVPAIVDVALWQRAQDVLTANRKNGLRRTKYCYLLEGLAVCGLCGAKMRMRAKSMQLGKYPRPAAYMCSDHYPYEPVALLKGRQRCTAEPVLVELADELAWRQICNKLDDPKLPELLAAERKAIASDARDHEGDADAYRKQLARLDKVDEAVWDRFRRGMIDDVALDRELAKTRRQRAAVSAQLKHAVSARGATINAQTRLTEAGSMMQRLRAKAVTATPEERRAIAKTLIDPGGAVFAGDELRIELLIDRPASVRASNSTMAVAGLSSDDHDERVRIQVVARLAA